MKTLIDMQKDFDSAIDMLLNANNVKDKSAAVETIDSLAKITKQKINSLALIQKIDLMSGRHDRVDAICGDIK